MLTNALKRAAHAIAAIIMLPLKALGSAVLRGSAVVVRLSGGSLCGAVIKGLKALGLKLLLTAGTCALVAVAVKSDECLGYAVRQFADPVAKIPKAKKWVTWEDYYYWDLHRKGLILQEPEGVYKPHPVGLSGGDAARVSGAGAQPYPKEALEAGDFTRLMEEMDKDIRHLPARPYIPKPRGSAMKKVAQHDATLTGSLPGQLGSCVVVVF